MANIGKRNPWSVDPLNPDGTPSTRMAYRVLRHMFEHHNNAYSAEDLGKALEYNSEEVADVNVTLRLLCMDGFVEETPPESKKYKYSTDIPADTNIGTKQAGFEKFIVDVDTEGELPEWFEHELSPSRYKRNEAREVEM